MRFGTCLVNICESESTLVTIRHVAQDADVSVGTVSRVLNNKPGVGGKTRQHVLAVARELGYTLPRRSPLSTSTVTHLGLLSRPMREALPANPFYADVFHGIEKSVTNSASTSPPVPWTSSTCVSVHRQR